MADKGHGKNINLADKKLEDQFVTGGIAIGEAGETALTGFTNTSIVGALNELGNVTDPVFTSMQAGNIKISDNKIVSVDTDGDIRIQPDGTGAICNCASDNTDLAFRIDNGVVGVGVQDQSQLTNDGFATQTFYRQSFTPSVSGHITEIGVWMQDFGLGRTNQLILRLGDINDFGTILFASVFQAVTDTLIENTYLIGIPVILIAGNKYTIQLVPNIGSGNFARNTSNPYPGGQGTISDLEFRTFMAPNFSMLVKNDGNFAGIGIDDPLEAWDVNGVVKNTGTPVDGTFTTLKIEDTVTIYGSDGTTPDGALTGIAGDICYNGPSGQPFFCTGGTSWTLMTVPSLVGFRATVGSNILNVTGNSTVYTVVFNTVAYDFGSNFSGGDTFTAPVAGVYRFTFNMRLGSVLASAGHTSIFAQIGAGGVADQIYSDGVFNDGPSKAQSGSMEVDMTMGQTAVCSVIVSGGTLTVDALAGMSFTGHLVG